MAFIYPLPAQHPFFTLLLLGVLTLTTFVFIILIKRPATKVQRIITVIASFVVACVFAYVALIAYGPAKGLYYRTFKTPAVLHAPFIEDFDQKQAQAQRERLISVYQSHTNSYGLRRTVGSVEGTPIGKCLVVENGNLTLIIDCTRDEYGNREFVVRHPTSIVLGSLTSNEKNAGWETFTVPERVYLKCYFDSKLGDCF